MQFYKASSLDSVASFITDKLSQQLKAGKRVLWLVPGGSSIAVAAEVAKQLEAGNVPLENLTVTLTDERYGAVGHPDSNWLQLEQVGFELPGATMQPVLTGATRDETVANFAKTLDDDLNANDYRLGFFGIGPDGHTAGILPHSPAVDSKDLAAGYDAGPLKRITMTMPAIARLDEAVAYAVGEPKWPVLDQLETDLPLADQPAQSLKKVPALTIFNDHKGETR